MTADIVAKIRMEFDSLGERWTKPDLQRMSLAALLYYALMEKTGAVPTTLA